MIKKKILSLLLVFAMVIGILPFGEMVAYAADPVANISRIIYSQILEKDNDGNIQESFGLELKGVFPSPQSISDESVTVEKIPRGGTKTENLENLQVKIVGEKTMGGFFLEFESETDQVLVGDTLTVKVNYQVDGFDISSSGDSVVNNIITMNTTDAEDIIKPGSEGSEDFINMVDPEMTDLTDERKLDLNVNIAHGLGDGVSNNVEMGLYLKYANGGVSRTVKSGIKELVEGSGNTPTNISEYINLGHVEGKNEVILSTELVEKFSSQIIYKYIDVKMPINYNPEIETVSADYGPITTGSEDESSSRVVSKITGKNIICAFDTDGDIIPPKVYLVPRIKEGDIDLRKDEDILANYNKTGDPLSKYEATVKGEMVYKGNNEISAASPKGDNFIAIFPKSSKLGDRDIVMVVNGKVTRKRDVFEYRERTTNDSVIYTASPKVVKSGYEYVVLEGKNIPENAKVTVDGVEVKPEITPKSEYEDNIKIVKFKAPDIGIDGQKIIQIVKEEGIAAGVQSYNYDYNPIVNIDGSVEDTDPIDTDGRGKRQTFEYKYYENEPTIDRIIPPQGVEGATITIMGSNFRKEDEADPSKKLVVYLGNERKEASEVTYIDTKTITFKVPDLVAPGNKRVVVKNPDGVESKQEIYFKYIVNPEKSSPEIEKISPNYTIKGKEERIKIVGTGFTKDVIVMFGGREGTDPVVTSDGKEILVRVPDFVREETVDVYVHNSDGGFTKKQDGFTYYENGNMLSVVTEIDPPKGSTAGGKTITLYGNFYKGSYSEVPGNPTALWPEIYFGENKAEYVPKEYTTDPGTGEKTPVYEWNPTKIDVVLPAYHKEGPVDVKVVNHISNPGITIFKSFTYEQSKPKINGKIEIPLKGGAIRYINGKSFIASPLSYTNTEPKTEKIEMDLEVIFGGTPVTERIRGQITTAKMKAETRDMEVEYDANVNTSVKDANGDRSTNIKVRIGDLFNPEVIKGTVTPTEPLYVSLKTSTGATVNEVLKVSVDTQNLKVERRLSTKAKVTEGGKLITFTTPPMEKTGETKFIVRNSDGGQAEGTANVVDPSSNPVITDIDEKQAEKDENQQPVGDKYFVDSGKAGGRVFTIRGSDFRTGVEVYIGYGNGAGNKAEVVELGPNGDYIIVKSPALPNGVALGEDLPIVVRNSDGGTADSSQTKVGVPAYPVYYIYREATSTPKIKEIDPNKGPALGGQEVTIYGEGQQFRPESGVEVRFGGRLATLVPEKSNYDKLVVITPPSDVYGKVDVSVRNIGSFGEDVLEDGYTYISAPVIIKLQPDIVYSSGGEKVEIIGKGFQDGAKVTIDGKEVEVKFVDQFKLEIVSPSVVLPNGVDSLKKDVTVVNPDGGEATKKDGITFTRPFPMRPTGFKATPQHGRTMLLEWKKVDIIERYRLEISESENGPYRYLAEVSGGEYLARDLKPDTKYYFRLWALNQYGQSQGFATANNKTYTNKEDNQSGEFEDTTETQSQVIESSGNVTINYAKTYTIEDYTHDLTASKYSSYRTITLNIPASVVNSGSGTLTLKHRDFELKSALSMFKSPERSYKDGEILRVTVTKLFDGEQSTALKFAPAGYVAQKQGVKVEYTVGDGKNNTALQNLNGVYLTTYVDKASLSELASYSYKPGESSLQKEQSNYSKVYSNVHKKEIYKLSSYIKRSGYYIPLGK